VTPRVIKVYDVIAAETVGGAARLSVEGNLWCGWGMGNAQQDGVKIFDPTGKPIGFIASRKGKVGHEGKFAP
jgi:gluconolactonase